ncbi:MAG: type I methionyl aminopeptidase, partial [Chloroflexi bacterium]|nr:type I methionyl aminopeptidase [Chloroflexota bacterium]
MKGVHLKQHAEIEQMRAAGAVVARVIDRLRSECQPGKTTADLDRVAAAVIKDAGGKASFLNYKVGEKVYPAHICTSINEEVVHGIPGPRLLSEGDIVGVDVGVFLNGFHADSAATIPVGRISAEAARLLEVTEKALWAGIAEAKLGRRVGSISAAIQRYAESRGYHIVRNLVGHGVGRNLHEEPQVPNYGKPGDGIKLEVGMTLAIEPMVNAGTVE